MNDRYEQYEHHGRMVWVQRKLRGLHRDHCLCFSCALFHPAGLPEANCKLANLNFAMDLETHMVTPVYECPIFIESNGGQTEPRPEQYNSTLDN